LEITPRRGKQDVVGAKIVKVFEFIKRKLEENDFQLKEAGWIWNKKALMWFTVKAKLGKTRTVQGPPLKLKSHVKEFKKKYKKTATKNRRIYTIIKRKYTDAEKLIKALQKEPYIHQRINKIKTVK